MIAFYNAVLRGSENTAMLVDDGRIVLCSTDEEILKQVSKTDETVDLKGQYVISGFCDSHMHLLELGFFLSGIQMHGCKCFADVKALIEKRLQQKDQWIIGRGFNEQLFTDHCMPERQLLDEISKDVPICLTRSCGHLMCVNSKALELAGIDENTEVEGGSIDLTRGILYENAAVHMHEAWPKPDVSQLKRYIELGMKECNRYGITTVGSDDFLSVTADYEKVLDAFEQMSYQQKLTVRVTEQCEFSSLKDYADFLDSGYTMDVGNDLFRIGPLKLVCDGSLGARTARMAKPYKDDPKNKGVMLYTKKQMEDFTDMAHHFNTGVICHCIGDGALDEVLQIFAERTLPDNPLKDGIVHCQIMRADQLEKISAMKLVSYFQSLFIDSDAKILTDRVSSELAGTCYPYRYLNEHTIACNGSDAPVEIPDVMKGIQLAVLRKTMDGTAEMNQDECLTADQALDSYTLNGAKALSIDADNGALKTGYHADFAVLDRNPETCRKEELSECHIVMTVMNGDTVYQRGLD